MITTITKLMEQKQKLKKEIKKIGWLGLVNPVKLKSGSGFFLFMKIQNV